jgi:hypothetical protein
MEMEMSVEMNETVERLTAAAAMLEAAAARMAGIEMQAAAAVTLELEEKLAAAEAKIAQMAARAGEGFGRKTLHAKAQAPAEGLEGAIDGALVGLSMEQRIAVKSQLMRSGVLG